MYKYYGPEDDDEDFGNGEGTILVSDDEPIEEY